MNRWLRWLLLIGALAAVITQFMYWWKFSHGFLNLSDSQEVWGQFGDYVGGVLNPIFSSLAFSGLVVTIVLQARQIDMMNRQSDMAKQQSELEIQRVQSTVADRIDGLLAAKVHVDSVQHQQLAFFAGSPMSVSEMVSALGTAATAKPEPGETNWLQWLWNDTAAEGLRNSLEAQTIPVRLEFESLAWMLSQYETLGGSPIVTAFYRRRYNAQLVWLDALGLLKQNVEVLAFFRRSSVSE
ncbi:hypothetical protein ASC95_22890 [Pelomonas sp. Root1217]|nr:hypothetical protein ASC95_22890 [Pelomonas sp. Root1217]